MSDTTMNKYGYYRSNDIVGATRIEMLLRLYREALESIAAAKQAQMDKQREAEEVELRRARRFTLGLLSGLDRDSELGDQQYRLLVFVIDCLQCGRLDAAEQVLVTLESGFVEIKDEAIALELQGEIPSMARQPVAMDCQA